MTLNEVTLIGRITKAPELKTVGDGKAVVKFSLAVERDFNGADGKPGVDFIPVVAWRKLAETVGKFVVKGQELKVEGRVQTRTFQVQGQDGQPQNRLAVEIVADQIKFGKKPKAQANKAAAPAAAATDDPGPDEPPTTEDDVRF